MLNCQAMVSTLPCTFTRLYVYLSIFYATVPSSGTLVHYSGSHGDDSWRSIDPPFLPIA